MVLVADNTVFRGLAEHFEGILGEAIAARTECLTTWREMGGPDLCHVVKYNPKANPKEIGSYHYVHGVDTSSSAAVGGLNSPPLDHPHPPPPFTQSRLADDDTQIAAYLNSLTYSLGVLSGGKMPAPGSNPYKVVHGTFCTFNAFSRVDVRVEVRIPGGVEAYLVDLRGERHPIPNALIWQETAVSSTLRCLLDDSDDPEAEDPSPSVMCLKRIDPLPTLALEAKFLDMCREEFWKGWQLGTNPDIQVATAVHNHLTNGLLAYFASAYRLGKAAKWLEPLFLEDEQVGALLAKCYLGNYSEIQAVEIMHESSRSGSYNYALLLVQCDFLLSKKRPEQALVLAKMAVTHAPCEFMTWAKLTQVYLELGDYESCLLALNSCPMFTYVEKDSHRMPMPARTHLPIRQQPDEGTGNTGGASSGRPVPSKATEDPRESEAHPDLLRIPSLSLRGTFKKAYHLLVSVVSRIGWDAMLQVRGNVFIMEDEYRVHRAILAENPGPEASPSVPSTGPLGATRAAAPASGSPEAEALDVVSPAPTATSTSGGKGSPQRAHKKTLSITSMLQRSSLDGCADGKGPYPVQDASGNPGSASSTGAAAAAPNPRMPSHSIVYEFRHKRLCEKWLDNLFMVLYNDLRLYTGLKQEMSLIPPSPANTTATASAGPKKTGAEWEIYGDLAMRLQFKSDARNAYATSNALKPSIRTQLKLLSLDSQQGETRLAMQTLAGVVEGLDKAYIDHLLPSPVSKAVFHLIARHGLQKVQNVLLSLHVPPHVFRLISKYWEYAEVFQVQGYDW